LASYRFTGKGKKPTMSVRPDRSAYHQPVLLHEAIRGLDIRPAGTYVDATFGGGGHSRAIMEKLGPEGRLIAFDQDEDAAGNTIQDDRFILVMENFRHLRRFLRLHDALPVNGILADLGVSSHQFDTTARGFSIRQESENAPLDMRMDKRQGLTAAKILQAYSVDKLQMLFERYGEVRNARTLAQRIVQARASFPMKTVAELKAIAGGVSKGNPQRYFSQVFQALRIAVNEELEALGELLQQAFEVLGPGGRLAVITFHSLEDRIVKDFVRSRSDTEKSRTREQTANEWLVAVEKKPVLPSAGEVKENPRARSARLRVAEKVVVKA
jgi:16S rRNA (cytosine1402-N4)-methyltransferase